MCLKLINSCNFFKNLTRKHLYDVGYLWCSNRNNIFCTEIQWRDEFLFKDFKIVWKILTANRDHFYFSRFFVKKSKFSFKSCLQQQKYLHKYGSHQTSFHSSIFDFFFYPSLRTTMVLNPRIIIHVRRRTITITLRNWSYSLCYTS